MDTRSQEQKRMEETLRQLKESSDVHSNSIKEIKDSLLSLSIKMEQMISRNLMNAGDHEEVSPRGNNSSGSSSIQTRYTKIEFPRFQGEDPAGWAYKCERFFEFNQIEEGQRVKLASVHLDEKAIQWYQWYEKTQSCTDWKNFIFDLQVRFGHNAFEDAIGELTKLRQETSVKAYQERFEELANRTSGLSAEFFVSCFLSGLKTEIKNSVHMFQPSTLSQAIGLARLQEETFEAIERRNRIPLKTHAPSYSPGTNFSVPKPPTITSVTPKTQTLPPVYKPNPNPTNLPIRRLTEKEMEARREKGLCYNCDEKFIRGHRCQRKQLFLLIGDDEVDGEGDSESLEITEDEMGSDVQISMHALAGWNSFRTMRVKGRIKGREITILIDSGSTHNFLETSIAKRTGISIQDTPSLSVAVADGTKLSSKAICKELVWEMQGHTFTAEVRMLSLGGCDMVLGVQWLTTLGPILWDFGNLNMQFQLLDQTVVLKGENQLKWEHATTKQMEKTLKETKKGFLACLYSLAVSEEKQQTNYGDIEFGFYPAVAPQTVNHIFKLVRLGCYNTNHFFRVDQGFVAQVADVVGGRTAPMNEEQRIEAEKTVVGEFSAVKHVRGILSMGRYSDPNSAQSSFSVLLGDAPHLDGQYAIFGRVTKGDETLRKLEQLPTRREGIFVMPTERITIVSSYYYDTKTETCEEEKSVLKRRLSASAVEIERQRMKCFQ